jgi:predicted metal-binding membrane protein
MRYRLSMSGFAHQHSFNHLSAPEARMSAALSQPRFIAIGCIVALTALGWLSIGLMSVQSALNWLVLCQPNAAAGVAGLALVALMWMAMTLAMMLPTAGPMILTYAEIADTAARKREAVVSPLVLATGYIAVWLGFAMAAAGVQWLVGRAGLFDGVGAGRFAAGVLFIAAGLYQFSSLKRACLTLCQRPFPFFFANWTTERSGVLWLGVRQGMLCLGCCWAMMALMFALGAMNVVWMAALGVIMTVEKISTTIRFSQAVGVGFVAIGSGLIALSAV